MFVPSLHTSLQSAALLLLGTTTVSLLLRPTPHG
jgi:hypothetical protein